MPAKPKRKIRTPNMGNHPIQCRLTADARKQWDKLCFRKGATSGHLFREAVMEKMEREGMWPVVGSK